VTNNKDKTKYSGQVFTPDYLVGNMLDYSNYNDKNILQKHIIDNSCGEGAFLIEIVERYCQFYMDTYQNTIHLKEELQKFIHDKQ
jgi:adenine-specific DNA-methyltransferase